MRTKHFLLLALLAFSTVAFAQNDDAKYVKRFKKKLPEQEFIRAIKANKAEAELVVGQLKEKNVANADLIKSYETARKAYDEAINVMITDVNNANTIGGLVEEIIESKSRRATYKELGDKADLLCKKFIEDGYKKLNDKKGFWKTAIDWLVSFIPGSVAKISDAALSLVKTIIVEELESTRLKTWNQI